MPNTVVHLWIARQLSEAYPHLLHPDFYLGSILPDAIYSRSADVQKNNFITHIYRDGQSWERDVLESWRRITAPTPLETGYYAHILTDLNWHGFMREYYAANQVPPEKRGAFDKILVPHSIRQLFLSEADYLRCVDFAEKSSVRQYPFMITAADVAGSFSYARRVFQALRADEAPALPPPDYRAWCGYAIGYLKEKLPLVPGESRRA